MHLFNCYLYSFIIILAPSAFPATRHGEILDIILHLSKLTISHTNSYKGKVGWGIDGRGWGGDLNGVDMGADMGVGA